MMLTLRIVDKRNGRLCYFGQLRNFTGIESPYEPPENPELRLKTVGTSPAQLALQIQQCLERFLRSSSLPDDVAPDV